LLWRARAEDGQHHDGIVGSLYLQIDRLEMARG
jgi:hypothetical protein